MMSPDERPQVEASGKALLEQVAALVEAREDRPSWDQYFMSAALLFSLRSACERLHVGCVLVSGGAQCNRIVAAGYNGFLPGAPHISHLREGHEQATVHAEQNAIADAARRGISLEGATAYISHFPCINCAKILASSGINCIKYHWDYRNDPLVRELLGEIGISIEQI
jgi:dCMP deaminase